MKTSTKLLLHIPIFGILFTMAFNQCTHERGDAHGTTKIVIPANISDELPWSQRIAQSVIKRAPESWMVDFNERPRWNYTPGLLLNAVSNVSKSSGNPMYYQYAQSYGDTMILADGSIRDYDITRFNIDHVAPGPLMFRLWKATGDDRYKTAIETLKRQLDWQPVTSEGGYWHKLRYPWQMWLDGLYMGEPFQAEYAIEFDKPELFDHIVDQFVLAYTHTKDDETGLLYHGWDESRIQRWANPETGCSEHFWARAIGWYVMGLVDVLDFIPADHPRRPELVNILDNTLKSVLKVRDPETKTWWQMMVFPNREGNYLESTSTCMFTYAMIKGVNNGYLDESYRTAAAESFQGIKDNFIKVDENGEVHLTRCCAVAGLGGNPYRDGSYEYYVGEPIRDNDPKGLGPLINLCLEFEKNLSVH